MLIWPPFLNIEQDLNNTSEGLIIRLLYASSGVSGATPTDGYGWTLHETSLVWGELLTSKVERHPWHIWKWLREWTRFGWRGIHMFLKQWIEEYWFKVSVCLEYEQCSLMVYSTSKSKLNKILFNLCKWPVALEH